jgi:hypothetical protein
MVSRNLPDSILTEIDGVGKQALDLVQSVFIGV